MVKFVLITFMSVSVAMLAAACFMNVPEKQMTHPLSLSLAQLRQELPVLDLSVEPLSPSSFVVYRDYYRLTFEDTKHFWGTFKSGTYRLAAHVFLPSNARGTVFLIHGYLDHIGSLAPLIQNCLEQQFAVAVYDLPGHGLSDGPSASIRNFDEYAEIFKEFFHYCRPQLPAPYHAISHSTGSAITLEYLTQAQERPFDRVVFLAPLVRHSFWNLSKIGYALGKPFRLKTVPRRSSVPSSNSEFTEFVRQDPLQPSRVPLQWVGEVYEWNKDIHNMTILPLSLLIVQGTDDSVVDWKYNIPFLQKKIEGISVKLIQNAEHQLINEPLDIRKEVFRSINDYLEGQS